MIKVETIPVNVQELNVVIIVDKWIDLEYYFSTVDNHVYGASPKVYYIQFQIVGGICGNKRD